MSFAAALADTLADLRLRVRAEDDALDRLAAELDFARRLAVARPDRREEWEALLQQALQAAAESPDPVAAAEAVLAPLSPACKAYTIHCAGHAHIDMNWMWNWPETVATTNDTVTTVLRLMREFPSFCFSQSQASVYQILRDYLPELWDEVKQRVAEGRWEITANHWVEGDKNLASGETLCRHLLYTKRFFEREMGIPYDRVLIDWEPDTFGHCATLPTLL
ncbi:MAG: hypothetical protein HYU66_00240, partial [Armatimonadetes bacterium]|nr:hypothetical protein [Armatimonadota bacterium]